MVLAFVTIFSRRLLQPGVRGGWRQRVPGLRWHAAWSVLDAGSCLLATYFSAFNLKHYFLELSFSLPSDTFTPLHFYFFY